MIAPGSRRLATPHALLVGLIAIGVVGPMAHAVADPVPRYSVAMTLDDHGVRIGTPTLVVTPNSPSAVEIGGTRGYRIDFVAVPQPDDQIAINSTVTLYQLPVWRYSTSTGLLVRDGETAAIELAHSPGDPVPGKFRMAVTVHALD